MTMAVFNETMRRNWKQGLIWGIGFLIFGWYSAILVPDMAGLQRYVEIFQSMPSGLMSAFGFDQSSVETMATPEGFFGLYVIYFVLILAVYGVLSGLSITANDEETGIMDMVLSLPLPRWRLIVEKFLAYSVLMIVIMVLSAVGMVIGDMMTPNLDMDVFTLLSANLSMVPSGLVVMGITALLGALVRRRNTAATLASVYVTISFLGDNMARSAQSDIAQAVRSLSVFKYSGASDLLLNGVALGAMLVLLAATVVLLASSVALYQRRDVRV